MGMNMSPDGGEMLDPHADSELGSSIAAAALRVGLCASVFAIVIAIYAAANDRVAVGLWVGGVAVILTVAFGAALKYRTR
ncbi:hypothetical protein [Streptomyces sp. NPDC052701]|uniref:hypothetical protein n=1 Tax=Streptomyces sp. NPDC052701 TaxID=3155533 RepID=UPI00343BEA8D